MRISDWSSDVCSSDLVRARYEILGAGTEGARIGLANSAVNMWSDEKLRQTSGEVLVECLKGGSKDLVAVVMDVFRVTDDLVPDTSTVELLQALVDPSTDMSAAPSHFVVERLQGLLPYEAELISAIVRKSVV